MPLTVQIPAGLILNPLLKAAEKKVLTQLFKKYYLKKHFFLTSSGSAKKSNESLKLIALSEESFRVSAQAVNKHLETTTHDIWLNPLPLFHVGGLSTVFRAQLGNYQWLSYQDRNNKWNPVRFHQTLLKTKATLTSLVPTQLFDLVEKKLISPTKLRAVVIGGDKLSPLLKKKAQALGWPVLESYGMTETCSQVATEKISQKGSGLQILSHAEIKISRQGLIQIKSPSLLTGYAQKINGKDFWQEPVSKGFYTTQDLGQISKGSLIPLGRESRFVKILGEGVSLDQVQNQWQNFLDLKNLGLWNKHTYLGSKPEPRSGQKLILFFEPKIKKNILTKILTEFNSEQKSIERILHTQSIPKIPRTSLGKIKNTLSK